ncbi:MAG TPA: FmdB family zinc ribbon protein [Bryobacteraceae bacterium]|jgi:putative FmdB family regulatory protein|nr:FmdB family zinc ribbon protein [Bryobacteraceae bacterium]
MPLYEYLCDTCGERFEVMQKFSDGPLTTHEKCGGTVNRLLSVPALQFKGSGWYVNDYAKAGSPKEAGSSKESGSSKEADSSKEKPAAASTTKTDGNSNASATPAAPSKSTESKPSTT